MLIYQWSPQTKNLTFNQNLQVPDFEEDPTTNDHDNDTIPTVDDGFQWQPYHPENNFSCVHSIIFHCIEQWATLPSSKSHQIYPQFQHFEYAGLKTIMQWVEVHKVCKIQNTFSSTIC
jgi:hypothetical protein